MPDAVPPASPIADDLIARYQAGESLLSLSRETGAHRSTLAREIRGAGVELRGLTEAMRLRADPPRTPAGTLALRAAAAECGINRRVLARAIDAGLVRATRLSRPGTGVRYHVVLSELQDDLATRPRCTWLGCDRPALLPDGSCGTCGGGRKRPRTPPGDVALHVAAPKLGISRRKLRDEIQARNVRATVIVRPGAPPLYHLKLDEAREDVERLPPSQNSPREPVGRECARCGASLGLLRTYDKRLYCDACRWTAQPRTGQIVTCPGCGKMRYRPPALLGTGDGWCLKCWNQTDRARETRRRARDRVEALVEEVGRVKRDRGLLGTAEVARLCLVSPAQVAQWVASGLLVAERHKARGHLLLYDPAAVKQLKRDTRALGRVSWLDPDSVVASYRRFGLLANGMTEEQVRQMVAARRRAFLGGRPPSQQPAHHQEWLAAFLELSEYYQRRACAGDDMPSDWQICLEVAAADFSEHPERWDYDPAQARQAAVARVSKATKSLQI